MEPQVELQQTDFNIANESTDPPKKISRQQTLVLISIASVNFSAMICYSILGPFFPVEAVKKGASQTVVGIIFGCFAVFYLITSLIAGRYIVQIGAKLLLVSGLCVSGVTTIIFGFLDRAPEGATFISLCFVVRSIDAVGFGSALTSSFAIVAKTFPNNIASVFGLLEIFTGLGLILGPPIGGWLFHSFGYEVPFLFLGCFVLIMVPINIYILPSIETNPTNDSFFGLLTYVKVILICYVIFMLSSGLGFLDATLSLFAVKMFGLSADYVGLIMLGFSLPYCLTSPLIGYFVDRFPATRNLFMVIGSLATGISFWLIGPVPIFHIPSQLWLTVFMLCLCGFFLGVTLITTVPEMITCAYELGYEEGLSTFGMVSGLFSAVWAIGMFYGPIVGGVTMQHLSFEWAAAIQGGLGILGGLLLLGYNLSQRLRSRQQNERTPLLND
ncbi:MFS-type transporter SLC18B1-like [Genypterus blacodes]|uniref:MFS-type transporter SLC18B1-like n=1 Tax=Genypterus blacodes TaxID=154954 RepID=UPI003F7651FE